MANKIGFKRRQPLLIPSASMTRIQRHAGIIYPRHKENLPMLPMLLYTLTLRTNAYGGVCYLLLFDLRISTLHTVTWEIKYGIVIVNEDQNVVNWWLVVRSDIKRNNDLVFSTARNITNVRAWSCLFSLFFYSTQVFFPKDTLGTIFISLRTEMFVCACNVVCLSLCNDQMRKSILIV